jgi:hypothetical protein
MFLAFTGAISYLGTAVFATLRASWPMAVASTTLATTSIWYHGTKGVVAYWVDQAAIQWFVGQALYDAYSRSWGEFAIAASTVGYACGIYYLGRRWNALAWGPNADLWHASIHGVSALVVSGGLLFSSPQDKCGGTRSTSPC